MMLAITSLEITATTPAQAGGLATLLAAQLGDRATIVRSEGERSRLRVETIDAASAIEALQLIVPLLYVPHTAGERWALMPVAADPPPDSRGVYVAH